MLDEACDGIAALAVASLSSLHSLPARLMFAAPQLPWHAQANAAARFTAPPPWRVPQQELGLQPKRLCQSRFSILRLSTTTMTRQSAIAAKQRRCVCAEQLGSLFVLSSCCRGSDERRLQGAQPRAAVEWENNTFVAFCRAAHQQPGVSAALALLEVRLTAGGLLHS